MGNIRIDLRNPSATSRRIGNYLRKNVMPIVDEQILSDSNTYVRMQDGTLASSGHVEGGKRIVWNTAYAKKVYYTGIPRRNVNPSAQLRWFEYAKRRHLPDWIILANRIAKGG